MGAIWTRTRYAILAYLVIAVAISGGVGWLSFAGSVRQLEKQGNSNLILAADRLTAYFRRYRELVVFLGDHPLPLALVHGDEAPSESANQILLNLADKIGALGVIILNADGTVLANTSPTALSSGARPAIERAEYGALGAALYLDDDGFRRAAYAAPIFLESGPVGGSILAIVAIDAIEWNWPAGADAVFFFDETGTVFVSNRSELILANPTKEQTNQSGLSLPIATAKDFSGHTIWRLNGGPYLPEQALHLSLPLPVINLTGVILLDLETARRSAWLLGTLTLTLLLALAGLLLLIADRRRVLSERLADEAASNAALEIRVNERTQSLSQANQSLRREIREREDAEKELKRAQSDLVQAGKLSALGKMSAGISHELNQPLMAIDSFAENAESYLDRGQTSKAANNLSRISDMSQRMGRIIKNLRAFARQENEPMTDVDLAKVVDAALEIMQNRLTELGVDVDWDHPEAAVYVRGGEVRLQQVVMNLASNAAEAMANRPTRRLSISISRENSTVQLELRDTGPGLTEADRIFDPFYTTKEVGKSEGMGLGLSISYGLVQSFGGQIKGRNHDAGGAVFTVELVAANSGQNP